MQYKWREPERKGSGKCTGSREGRKAGSQEGGKIEKQENMKQHSAIFCSQEKQQPTKMRQEPGLKVMGSGTFRSLSPTTIYELFQDLPGDIVKRSKYQIASLNREAIKWNLNFLLENCVRIRVTQY